MTTIKTNGLKSSEFISFVPFSFVYASVVAEYLQETDILHILNCLECKPSHKKTSQEYCINIKSKTDCQPVISNALMNLEHILILS